MVKMENLVIIKLDRLVSGTTILSLVDLKFCRHNEILNTFLLAIIIRI